LCTIWFLERGVWSTLLFRAPWRSGSVCVVILHSWRRLLNVTRYFWKNLKKCCWDGQNEQVFFKFVPRKNLSPENICRRYRLLEGMLIECWNTFEMTVLFGENVCKRCRLLKPGESRFEQTASSAHIFSKTMVLMGKYLKKSCSY
jgi:hypothetical protein